MTTYNKIISYFKDFANKHKQLNTFFSGQTWNFQAKENLYPAMVVVPISSEITRGQSSVTFNIIITDILNKDRTNLDEIYSDMFQIQQDLFALLNNSDEDFNIEDVDVVTAEPFEESFDDVLAGWISTIVVKFAFSGSICNLPLND